MVVSTTASSADADSQQTPFVSEKTEDDNANANGQDRKGGPNQAGGGGEGKEIEGRPTPGNARASTSAAQAHDETHSQLYSKVQKATEKYRAMTVPEMVSERGDRIIVIQPGSHLLRIGVASAPEDVVEVPNCVAYRSARTREAGQSPSKRQRVGEEGRVREVEDDPGARDVGCREIETLLGLSRASRKSGKVVEAPVLTRHEALPAAPKKEGDSGETTKLYGADALEGAKGGGYDLHFCIRAGHLRHDEVPSVEMAKQRCADLWSWVVHTRLKISKEDIGSYSCLLVTPSVTTKREVRDLVDVVLRDMGMREIAVHNESVAAIFTHACPVACVVNVDTDVTTVTCLEDGMCLANSKVVLPYGRLDVYRLLRMMLQTQGCWPYRSQGQITGCQNGERYGGLGHHTIEEYQGLERIYRECCEYVTEEDKAVSVAVGDEEAPLREISRKVDLLAEGHRHSLALGSEAKIAPLGLYFPRAFGLTRGERARRWGTHDPLVMEDNAVDQFMLDAYVNRDFGNVVKKQYLQPEHKDTEALAVGPPGETGGCAIGIDTAVVRSILDNEKPELKTRLFNNIVFVGDLSCEVRGCIDTLEARVLARIPQSESTINTVNVAKPKVSSGESVFRGGALLGILDFLQENWIQRKEWLSGGTHPGQAKRLTRMNKLSLQTLWHGAY